MVSARSVFAAFTCNHAVEHFVSRDLNTPKEVVAYVNCTEKSFGLLPYKNTFRRVCIRIAYAQWFSILVLCAILLNSVALLLDDPALSNIAWLTLVLDILDYIFLAFFTIEMIIKMIAHGLILHSKSYFRDLWNWIDFLVVTTGFIAIIFLTSGSGVSALRVVRVLRPLRSFARVRSLRHILTRFMKSLPRMVDVFILLAFVTWMFGIVGIQFFSGILHQRCYADVNGFNTTTMTFLPTAAPTNSSSRPPPPPNWQLIQNDTRICTVDLATAGRGCGWSENGVGLPQRCTVITQQYQKQVLNWDNMFFAFLQTFKVVCRDNWPDDLNDVANALGGWTFLYFFAATLFAGYFCVNLFIAVLSNAFSKRYEDDEADVTKYRTLPLAAVLGASCVTDACIVAATLRAQKGVTESAGNLTNSFIGPGTLPSPSGGSDENGISQALAELGNDSDSSTTEDVEDELTESDEDEELQMGSLPRENQLSHNTALRNSTEGERKKPPRCIRFLKRFSKKKGIPQVERVVKSTPYTLTVLLIVLFNSIVLSLDRYDASESLTNFINISSLVCTVLFLIDAALKITGLGPSYFRSKANIADFILCGISISDLVTLSASGISALRAFRLIRLLKLAKNWSELQHLLRLTLLSLRSVASLSLLALIIIYIYAILGFQLFGESIDGTDFGFANVFDSFLTVFVIITGENWASMMQYVMANTSYLAVLYFVSLVIFGNFMLTNLFIAIILENFGDGASEISHDDDSGAGADDAREAVKAMAAPTSRRLLEITYSANDTRTEREELDAVSDEDSSLDEDGAEAQSDGRSASAAMPTDGENIVFDGTSAIHSRNPPVGPTPGIPGLNRQTRMISQLAESMRVESNGETQILKEFVVEQNVEELHIVGDTNTLIRASDTALRKLEVEQNVRIQLNRRKRMAVDVINRLRALSREARRRDRLAEGGVTALTLADHTRHKRYRTTAEKEAQELQWIGLKQYAWCCLSPDNRLRMGLARVLKSQVTEWFLVFLTVSSSVFLAIDRPQIVDKNPGLDDAIFITDVIFAVIFVIEFFTKLLVLGPIGHPGAYFRSIWNWIDFIVSLASMLALFIPVLKTLRVLRVLRLTNLSFNLKVIVSALAASLPGMGSVIVLCCFLWWVYAVLGIALFKGNFYHCTDETRRTRWDCVGLYNDTSTTGAFGETIVVYNATRRWIPLRDSSTFDSIENALYSLLKLALSDGWFQMMYWGIDSAGFDVAPSNNASPWSCLYFISFMIFGNFFIVNLFIGVLVDRFVRHRARGAGFDLISESQRQWVLSQKVLFRTDIPPAPKRPANKFRSMIFTIVQNPAFDHFFFGVIVLNCIVLSMYLYETPGPAYDDFLYWTSLAIIILFTIEMLLKLIALNVVVYFTDSWNRLDALIVVLSWVGFGIGSGADVVRVFRVLRLFLLIRKMKGLQTLFISLWQAVPELLNVGVVLTVSYFIFGYVGVQLFSDVRKTGPINSLVNFDDVGHAFVALYQATTTENWADIVDALRSPAECDPAAGDCGTVAAIPFFVIFMILFAFILMNLLVTVVIDSFSEAEMVEGQEASFQILELFRAKWIEFDTNARQRLDVAIVLKILPTLPAAVWDRSSLSGRGKYRQTPWQNMLRQLTALHVPIDHHLQVSYTDVVASLAMRLFCITVPQAIAASQRTPYGVTWKGNKFTIHHHFAAKLLTHVVRRWLQTRRERALESQLRQLRDQHAVMVETEIEPLRQSHHETTILARWLLQKLAVERDEQSKLGFDPPQATRTRSFSIESSNSPPAVTSSFDLAQTQPPAPSESWKSAAAAPTAKVSMLPKRLQINGSEPLSSNKGLSQPVAFFQRLGKVADSEPVASPKATKKTLSFSELHQVFGSRESEQSSSPLDGVHRPRGTETTDPTPLTPESSLSPTSSDSD